MREYLGELFSRIVVNEDGEVERLPADAICVTSNGFIKSNGEAVMGRGVAAQAKKKYKNIAKNLGNAIREKGNVPSVIYRDDKHGFFIVSFPVKPAFGKCNNDKSNVVPHMRDKFKPGDSVPGWACVADVSIIRNSAKRLVKLADRNGWKCVLLSRPGCRNGCLTWEEVRGVITSILDDRFCVLDIDGLEEKLNELEEA